MKSPVHNILVVDDDKHIRQLFLKIIAMCLPDTRVDAASNGKEAVTMFRDLNYQIIVMDVVMPVMDGEQAFREIQKFCTEHKKNMPSVIFCTGYEMPDNITRLAKTDKKHCIVNKPVINDSFVDIIKQKLAAE